MPKRVFQRLFNELRYELFPKMRIVAQMGSIIKRAFFVLEGELWVLKHKVIKDSEEKTMKISRKLRDEEELFRFFPDHEISEIIRKGFVFGEKCLEKDEFWYLMTF